MMNSTVSDRIYRVEFFMVVPEGTPFASADLRLERELKHSELSFWTGEWTDEGEFDE